MTSKFYDVIIISYSRDCWPILDKKREQGFRKTCCNWLTNISQVIIVTFCCYFTL